MESRKVYVEVLLRVDEEGNNYPVSITWEDGQKFEIDRLCDVRRACATKVGGTAIRYTVRIKGKTTYLFSDDGKWFVESK